MRDDIGLSQGLDSSKEAAHTMCMMALRDIYHSKVVTTLATQG